MKCSAANLEVAASLSHRLLVLLVLKKPEDNFYTFLCLHLEVRPSNLRNLQKPADAKGKVRILLDRVCLGREGWLLGV